MFPLTYRAHHTHTPFPRCEDLWFCYGPDPNGLLEPPSCSTLDNDEPLFEKMEISQLIPSSDIVKPPLAVFEYARDSARLDPFSGRGV